MFVPALQSRESLFSVRPKGSQALHLSLLVKGEGSRICNVLFRPLPHASAQWLAVTEAPSILPLVGEQMPCRAVNLEGQPCTHLHDMLSGMEAPCGNLEEFISTHPVRMCTGVKSTTLCRLLRSSSSHLWGICCPRQADKDLHAVAGNVCKDSSINFILTYL